MQTTVEDLFGQIAKHQLMPPAEIQSTRARWLRPGRPGVEDVARFSEWLRVNEYLSKFVISALEQGKAQQLTLNQYRLTDIIHNGAQDGDLLAVDPVDQAVRVQIVSPRVAQGPGWYEEFQQAARRLMNVQHPGIARVLDLGQARGLYYLVSEFVEGESLQEVLKKRGKLSPELAARIFALVFDALHALHQGGVSATELTADHLIFASAAKAAGGARTVRLVNVGFPHYFFDSSGLGLADKGPSKHDSQRAADTGGPKGPVAAPHPQEEIHILGGLLYRSLTGKDLPPPGTSIRATRSSAIAHSGPEIPSMLLDLLESLLDPLPANRPKSAGAVAKALRVFLKAYEDEKQPAVEERVVAPGQAAAAGESPGRDVSEVPIEAATPKSGEELTTAPAAQVPVETAGEPEINRYFRAVIIHEGSDLHLAVGFPPMLRVRNVIRHMASPPLGSEEIERLVQPILSARSRQLLEEAGGADFAHIVGKNEGRFRVNLFKQRGELGLVARRVNAKIPTIEQLRLPTVLERICEYDQGLVIIAGVTGSGKSTTLAALLEYINEREQVHILTIEDPIEYLFTGKKAVINQREVGIDVVDWDVALKHAVRQDPDVILVGEMRDRSTFEAGLHAAETGHLVFCTIHASSAPSTIGRILDLFPADMHASIRQSLAFNLKAIVCQKLLPSIRPGVQRVPANEIMLVNPTIRDLLLKAEDKKLADAIRIGFIEGMLDFNESLRQLVHRGDVSDEAALQSAPNPDALKMALKGITVAQPGIL
jgi:twitching motility protein PilT